MSFQRRKTKQYEHKQYKSLPKDLKQRLVE